MLVKTCSDGTSDRVCARCPNGFGYQHNAVQMSRPGTYSYGVVCTPSGENHTTREAGAHTEAECVCLFTDGDEESCTGGCLDGPRLGWGRMQGVPLRIQTRR